MLLHGKVFRCTLFVCSDEKWNRRSCRIIWQANQESNWGIIAKNQTKKSDSKAPFSGVCKGVWIHTMFHTYVSYYVSYVWIHTMLHTYEFILCYIRMKTYPKTYVWKGMKSVTFSSYVHTLNHTYVTYVWIHTYVHTHLFLCGVL